MTKMSRFGNPRALVQELSGKILFVSLFACTGAFTLGFDNAWWGGVLGNAYFNNVYGDLSVTQASGAVVHSLSSTQQSAGTALGQAGVAIGCLAGGWFADKVGRKNTFYWSAAAATCGCIVQLTSGINGGRYWQLVAGKIIICISTGLSATAIPLYLAETSPASIRGAAITTFGVFQTIGSFSAILVMFLVANLLDKRVWCVPMGIQLLGPIATFIFAPFLPESPRWLVEKGHLERARNVLQYLHGHRPAFDVDHELGHLEATIKAKLALGKTSWVDIFRGSNGKRTFIATGLQALQQAQGINFMGSYLVIFFQQLGFTNAFEILLIIQAVLLTLSCTNFVIQDYFGRRPLLLIGGAVQSVTMLAVGIITTVYPQPVGSYGKLCLFFVFMWNVAFASTWGNIPWTVSAELPSDEVRDKTLALSAFSAYATGLVVAEVSPYLQNPGYANLGGKIAYVWGGFGVIATIWVFFFVPELKGRTLEEIVWMFDRKVPLRKMGSTEIPGDTLPITVTPASQEVEALDKKETELEHLDS